MTKIFNIIVSASYALLWYLWVVGIWWGWVYQLGMHLDVSVWETVVWGTVGGSGAALLASGMGERLYADRSQRDNSI